MILMKPKDYAVLVIIAMMFLTGAYLYPKMPDPMATHWDLDGNVNGYSSPVVGVFLLPAMTLGIYLLFLLIPKIAVYRKNIMSFYDYYSAFMAGIVGFMAVVYASMLLLNLGYSINLNYIVLPATGLLFYGISFLLEKSKKNFFIGIRTPWTLSSDKVWEKTHKLGAKMFRMFGVLAFVSVIIPSGFMVFMASTFLGVIYLVVYSYFEYKKEKKN